MVAPPINNLGVWQNQSPDYEWELTTNFPNIGSLQYYPYGKTIKTFNNYEEVNNIINRTIVIF